MTNEWLAPHLAEGERAQWTHEPDDSRWVPALLSVALAAYLAFWVGFDGGSWWHDLPIWDAVRIPPLVGAIIAAAGFAFDAAQKILKHRFTAYALTDKRLHRVGLLRFMASDAWPIENVRIIERESKRKRDRARVRIEVRAPGGKRQARFRVAVSNAQADALAVALAARPSVTAR